MSARIHGLNVHFDLITGTAIAFTIIVTTTTAARALSKVLTRERFKWEDYTIFLAWAIYVVTEGMLVKCVVVGRHSKVSNDKYHQFNVEYAYVYSVYYFAIVALCIASICFLHRRIFCKRYIRITTTILFFVDLGWWVRSTIIELTFPSSLPETFPGDPQQPQFPKTYLTWWLAAGVIEVLVVTCAIIMPLNELRRLQLNRRKKLGMLLSFSVSFVCVGTGIARLATLHRPGKQHFDASIGDVWINTHLGSAIMGANIPLCWPIISHRKRLMTKLTSWTTSSRSRSRSSIDSATSNSTNPQRTSTSTANQTITTTRSTGEKFGQVRETDLVHGKVLPAIYHRDLEKGGKSIGIRRGRDGKHFEKDRVHSREVEPDENEHETENEIGIEPLPRAHIRS